MLTGQAKKDYQRKYMLDYMRKKRGSALNVVSSGIKTLQDKPQSKKSDEVGLNTGLNKVLTGRSEVVKPQSYNPMMVGYVPPKGI